MYLSYSGYRRYKDCPEEYWHRYENFTKLETPDDRLGSIYGSVVGRLVERFYNERLWRQADPKAFLESLVSETVTEIITAETDPKKGLTTLLWKGMEGSTYRAYENRSALEDDVRVAVRRVIRIIRHYLLIGTDVKAEVKLDSMIEGHKIGGRADVILTRIPPENDLVLFDGKGSHYRDKKSDKTQLLWYSLLYREQFRRLPDKIGFVYWRFDPPESVDWFEITDEDVDILKQDILETIKKIDAARPSGRSGFEAKPTQSGCQYCPYATPSLCTLGHAQNNKPKTRKNKSKS